MLAGTAVLRRRAGVPPSAHQRLLRGAREQAHPVRRLGVDQKQVPRTVHRRAQHRPRLGHPTRPGRRVHRHLPQRLWAVSFIIFLIYLSEQMT